MKIELQALEHAYPGGDKALDGVDLTLDGNEPVAIIRAERCREDHAGQAFQRHSAPHRRQSAD